MKQGREEHERKWGWVTGDMIAREIQGLQQGKISKSINFFLSESMIFSPLSQSK